MRSQMFIVGAVTALVGCNGQNSDKEVVEKPRVEEVVNVVPGKAISPQDQAKVSSIALKVLGHVSKAQLDIQTKNVDAAKKELAEAGTLLNILKEVLPTVKIIDHLWVANSYLSYVDTTDVQQDVVPILSSIDQIYDLLPEGKAKEHAKQAKNTLTKDKKKGAPKAKEELEAVEEYLDFRETDLSVSYTSMLLKAAQEDLDKDKTKEAADALQAVMDGVIFYDTAVIDPADVAARRIWIATQDFAGKNYKAAKTRLAKAKTALQDVALNGGKTQQEAAKHLISEIDAIDASKAADKTSAVLLALWQDARKLVDQPKIEGKK